MEDPLINQAMLLIWELSQGPVTVGEIAKKLPVTRRTLERKFRDALGHTVLEEINRCHLKRAKRLLNETDLSITEIAAAAGFPSIDTMGNVFRRVYQMSPGEYRIRHT